MEIHPVAKLLPFGLGGPHGAQPPTDHGTLRCAVMLRRILTLHPAHLSRPELILQMEASDAPFAGSNEDWGEALDRLERDELVDHVHGESVVPKAPTLRTYQLLGVGSAGS